jgi:type II secretory pathway component GspD/PulD (secretin)
MVTIQAVLVELAQDASDRFAKDKPGSSAAESKPGAARRGNSDLAVVDLDLTVPPEAILAGLRKLGVQGQLDVFNRVQVTTLDEQRASANFARQEPMITGVSRGQFGTSNNTIHMNSGLLLTIVPRVAGGGEVILEIDLNQSRIGRAEDGVVISTSSGGDTIRQPPIITCVLKSSVKTPEGKTVVVSARTAEYGARRIETVLLVSARVLNVKTERGSDSGTRY